MNITVIISANAEWRAVKTLYPALSLQQSPFGEFADVELGTRRLRLFQGGWGKISAAASAQYAIDHFRPDLLVNLGTCGGIKGRVQVGRVILVEETIIYDIFEQMGNNDEAIAHYFTRLDLSWLGENLPFSALRGRLLSADRDIVSQDVPMLIQKYDAIAADWESGALAWVAQRNGVRCLILRAVTDLVGEDGGEAYGNINLFEQRTQVVMSTLLRQLPAWLSLVSLSHRS